MARRAEAVPGPAPGESTAAQLGALLLAVAFAFLGNGLLGTVTGLRASAEGMPSGAIGVIMSAFFLGVIGGSLMAPRLIERVGHSRAFAAPRRARSRWRSWSRCPPGSRGVSRSGPASRGW